MMASESIPTIIVVVRSQVHLLAFSSPTPHSVRLSPPGYEMDEMVGIPICYQHTYLISPLYVQ